MMLTIIRNCSILCHVNLLWSLIVVLLNCSKGVDLGNEIGEKVKQYKMEEMCGQTVNMRNENIYAAVINFTASQSPPNCTFTIKPGSWKPVWDSLSVQIRNFDIVDFSCVTLKRVDAAGSYSKFVHRFCHDSYGQLYKQYSSSDRESLIFEYEEDRYTRVESYRKIRFDIAVTIYHVARCDTHECDNARCIPNELMCQGYDACGDGSDCPNKDEPKTGLSKGSIIAIILSVVFAVCLFLYCCFVRIKKMEEDSSRSSNPPDDLSDHRYSVHSSCNDIDVNSSLYREYWDDDDDDDSLEMQPFYTQEGVIRRPLTEHIHASHNDINTVLEQVVVPSASSSPPPPPSPPSSALALADVTNQVTNVMVEPPRIDVYDIDANEQVAAVRDIDDMFESADVQAPPPSYEEVITHEALYKTSSREAIDPT